MHLEKNSEILILVNYYNYKTESFILSQLDFFRKKGINYSLLAYNYSGLEKNVYSIPIGKNLLERIATIRLNSLGKFRLLFWSLRYKNGWNFSLYKIGLHFLDNQYDCIYCHFGTNGKLIAQLKSLGIVDKKSKVVVQFHGLDLNKSKYGVEYYQIFNKQVDYVIYGSELAFSLLQHFNIIIPRLLKIPVSLDFSKIPKVTYERREPKKIKLISVGRLIPLKGHTIALDLVRRLKSITSNKFLFEIVGDGYLRSELESRISYLGLEKEVILSGWKNHDLVLKSLADADIYLYTGIHDKEGRVEMQGLAILEAMALGLVLVSTKVGGVGEIVLDRRNGLIIDPNNLEAAAEMLKDIIENYQSFQNLRREAKIYARVHYSMDKVYQKFLDIFPSK